jgi:hypothetical protein
MASRFSEAAEIRMVEPLTRSPCSASSSSSSSPESAEAQPDWKPALSGGAGTANGRPIGGAGGGGGVAVPPGGVGAEGVWAVAPEEFCVYQAGGA